MVFTTDLRPTGPFHSTAARPKSGTRRRRDSGYPQLLLEFGDAFDFTGADFDGWCREVGFQRTEVLHLAGPASAGIAYKAK